MNERGSPEGDCSDVAALAARTAAGETIDPATLSHADWATPAGRSPPWRGDHGS
jgi:hypothetical protein